MDYERLDGFANLYEIMRSMMMMKCLYFNKEINVNRNSFQVSIALIVKVG